MSTLLQQIGAFVRTELDLTKATIPPSVSQDIADLQTAISGINTLLQSDDVNLDSVQELVDYIKNNRSLIDGITTAKVSVADIIDALDSTEAGKPLSAAQGKVLKGLVDALTATVAGVDAEVKAIGTYADFLAGYNTPPTPPAP